MHNYVLRYTLYNVYLFRYTKVMNATVPINTATWSYIPENDMDIKKEIARVVMLTVKDYAAQKFQVAIMYNPDQVKILMKLFQDIFEEQNDKEEG